jgi:hypothetical protein
MCSITKYIEYGANTQAKNVLQKPLAKTIPPIQETRMINPVKLCIFYSEAKEFKNSLAEVRVLYFLSK